MAYAKRPVEIGPDRPKESTAATAISLPRMVAGPCAVRRLQHHYRFVKLRRWSKELDRLAGPVVEPWAFSEPIDWAATHMSLDIQGREALGREYAAARWCP